MAPSEEEASLVGEVSEQSLAREAGWEIPQEFGQQRPRAQTIRPRILFPETDPNPACPFLVLFSRFAARAVFKIKNAK